MALPTPEPGLVIAFNYLWRREYEAGAQEARYPRPCAIVVAYRPCADEAPIVTVAPITTQAPVAGQTAVEIPGAVKRHLGLDGDRRSWAITDEANEFTWPGYDLAENDGGDVAYGLIPPRLLAAIRKGLLKAVREGRLKRTPR